MKGTMSLALCVLMFTACGLLGKKGVSKEQINADLADKTVKAKEGSDTEAQTEWHFKDDSYRCFAPSDNESKTTESAADIALNVSAIRLTDGEDTPVLFGEILLHYKKDDAKWVLESIEPKDLRTKAITGDAFSKFVDLQMPLCNYFKYKTEGK